MNVKERILAIRLSESIRRQPEYANLIGVTVEHHKEGQVTEVKAGVLVSELAYRRA